ncbi:MAG: hypothetical protein ACYST9_05775 [Planctomycetota bacterium]|jgi:hypothetical protein
MKKDKPTTGKDKARSESETQEMTTLFSSDNTELTDFTQRVKQAIRGEQPDRRRSNAASASKQSNPANRKGNVSSLNSNVVNLFKPK